MVNGGAERPENLVPKRAGGSGGRRLRGQVLEGFGDVGAAVAALGGRLVGTKLGLNLGSKGGGNMGTEEPTEAGGKLDGGASPPPPPPLDT